MVDLPRIGTAMFVVHSEGVNYRSRLEEVDGNKICLAAPLETNGNVLPLPGNKLDVFWALPRTRVILPTRLVEIGSDSPYRWVVEPIGTPRQSNRRQYVRGGGGGPVRLAFDDDADDAVVGRLLDISEGGLRAWVAKAPKVGTGDSMQAHVPLGSNAVEVSGAVLSVRDAFDEPGQHLILRFEAGEPIARVIRQHVFAWEVAERRRFQEL